MTTVGSQSRCCLDHQFLSWRRTGAQQSVSKRQSNEATDISATFVAWSCHNWKLRATKDFTIVLFGGGKFRM